MNKNLRGAAILLLAAIIWGFAFVAQSVGMENVGAFTFQASRMLLASLVLLPTALISGKIREKSTGKKEPFLDKKTLLAGRACGIFLFGAASLQQIGIAYTTVGHASFLTAMYLLIVPLLGIFTGKKVGARIWFCIALAIVGLYLLCMTGEGFSMSLGDVLSTLCAFVFALHIITVDKLATALRVVIHFIIVMFAFYACLLLPLSMPASSVFVGLIFAAVIYAIVMGLVALFRSRYKRISENHENYEKKFNKKTK